MCVGVVVYAVVLPALVGRDELAEGPKDVMHKSALVFVRDDRGRRVGNEYLTNALPNSRALDDVLDLIGYVYQFLPSRGADGKRLLVDLTSHRSSPRVIRMLDYCAFERALIVKKTSDGFVVFSGRHALCVDTKEYEHCKYLVSVFREMEDADYCPLGKACKNPIEGWKDLLPFSVLLVPKGIVITDGKTSLGIGIVPEAVHVDMLIGEGPSERDVPLQDIRTLQEGDHVDPLGAVVHTQEQIHYMKLEPRWFDLIASGEKVVEGRLYDEKRKRIRVGHVIQFKNVQSGEVLYVKVKKMVIYRNFAEMLDNEKTSRVLPGLEKEEGLKVYEKFYGPDAGPVLAIGIELL